MHQFRHRAIVRHVGGGQTRHAAALRLHQRHGAALKVAGQQKDVKGVHEGGHIALHARENDPVRHAVLCGQLPQHRLLFAAAHQHQMPAGVGFRQRRKHAQQKLRVFLVVQPPHKARQPVGVRQAIPGADVYSGGGVRVKAALVHRVAGHRKVCAPVDVVAKHEPPRRHAAAKKIVGGQLVDAVGQPPGQRHGRVDDVAVDDELGLWAEQPHHDAHRRTHLAGGVVVDDVVIPVLPQMAI